MTERFDDVPNLAIFCDFENVALGVRDAHYDDFDIQLVLERLLDKGKIVVKKAYADWDRYKAAKRGMHEAAFEMIEIPHVSYSGKNSADIRLVVDALDLCHTKEHVDVFVIVSGDSDFSPLVSKLRENAKRVIGLGVKSSSSHLLIDNCDEFIYYDDLQRGRKDAARKEARRSSPGSVSAAQAPSGSRRDGGRQQTAPQGQRPPPASGAGGGGGGAQSTASGLGGPSAGSSSSAQGGGASVPGSTPSTHGSAPLASPTGLGTTAVPTLAPSAPDDEKSEEQRRLDALDMVLDVVEALFEDRSGAIYGSMVKQVLKRKRPEFSERFHGYRTFNDLLEDAGKRGLLEVEMDEKSGGYVVAAFGPKA